MFRKSKSGVLGGLLRFERCMLFVCWLSWVQASPLGAEHTRAAALAAAAKRCSLQCCACPCPAGDHTQSRLQYD